MFSSLLAKPLILALILSLSLCSLFGYLSYSFYGKYSEANSRLDIALEANVSLVKSSEKQRLACTKADALLADYIKEKAEKDKQTVDVVAAIDTIPKKQNKIEVANKDVEINAEIDIDSKLPSSLSGLLNEAYITTQ